MRNINSRTRLLFSSFRDQVDKLKLAQTDVWLGAISFLPLFFIFFSQYIQAGFYSTIGGTIAISDSAGWQNCASSVASLSLPQSAQLDWCLRRPLGFIFLAPLFLISPLSAGGAMVIQSLILSLSLLFFLILLRKTFALGNLALFIIALILLWPNFVYGGYQGPEAIALSFAYLSAALILIYTKKQNLILGFASGTSILISFQMRPGNILLTLAVITYLVISSFFAKKSLIRTAALAGSFIGVYLAPNAILRAFGFREAGNSTNFWATTYSAATPANDWWAAAYTDFSSSASKFGRDSFEFGEILRNATFEMIREHPEGILNQFKTNIFHFFDSGFLNLATFNPFVFTSDSVTLVALSQKAETGELISSITSLLLWGFSWLLITLLFLAGAKIIRNALQKNSKFWKWPKSPPTIGLLFGLVTILGALLFFALAGHDESQRHLLQNLPFWAIGAAASLKILSNKSEPEVAHPKVIYGRLLISSVFLFVILCIAIVSVEGRVARSEFVATRACGGSTFRDENFVIIADANFGSGYILPTSSSWRVKNPLQQSRQIDNQLWLLPTLESFPPGHLVTARSDVNGQTIVTFISDEIIETTQGLSAKSLCFHADAKDIATAIGAQTLIVSK